jgi:hypothetical protein
MLRGSGDDEGQQAWERLAPVFAAARWTSPATVYTGHGPDEPSNDPPPGQPNHDVIMVKALLETHTDGAVPPLEHGVIHTMTDSREMTQTAQNQTLDFVRQSQDAFVEAMQVWSDSLNSLVGTTQARSASVNELPKPEEVLDQVFDFAESLLAAQREFAHNVVRTASTGWAQGEQVAEQESQKASSAATKTTR